jgi:hypothetical protein
MQVSYIATLNARSGLYAVYTNCSTNLRQRLCCVELHWLLAAGEEPDCSTEKRAKTVVVLLSSPSALFRLFVHRLGRGELLIAVVVIAVPRHVKALTPFGLGRWPLGRAGGGKPELDMIAVSAPAALLGSRFYL